MVVDGLKGEAIKRADQIAATLGSGLASGKEEVISAVKWGSSVGGGAVRFYTRLPSWQVSLGTTFAIFIGACLVFLWIGSRQLKPNSNPSRRMKKQLKEKKKAQKKWRKRFPFLFSDDSKQQNRRRGSDDGTGALRRSVDDSDKRYVSGIEGDSSHHGGSGLLFTVRRAADRLAFGSSSNITDVYAKKKKNDDYDRLKIPTMSRSFTTPSAPSTASNISAFPTYQEERRGSDSMDEFRGIRPTIRHRTASTGHSSSTSSRDQDDQSSSNLGSSPSKSPLYASLAESSDDFQDIISALSAQSTLLSFLDAAALKECVKHLERNLELEPHEFLFGDQSNTPACDGSLFFIREGSVVLSITADGHHKADYSSSSKAPTDPQPSSFMPFSTSNSSKSSFDTILQHGDSVTSLLTMLAALADHALSHTSSSSRTSLVERVSRGVSVRAGEKGATLWRLPPHAITGLIGKFPNDVMRMAQAITARLQRVTIRTLVDSLGLGPELFSSPTSGLHGQTPFIPPPSTPIQEAEDEEDLSKARLEGCNEDSKQMFRVALDMLAVATGLPNSELAYQILLEPNATTDINVDINHMPPGKYIRYLDPDVDVDTNEYVYLILKGEVETYLNPKTSRDSTDNVKKSVNSPASSTAQDDERSSKRFIGKAHKGELLGALQLLTPHMQLISYRTCKQPSAPTAPSTTSGLLEFPSLDAVSKESKVLVLAIPAINVWTAMRGLLGGAIAAALFRSILSRLSDVVFLLDWSLEWTHLRAGKELFKRGESASSVYMVISGRLGAMSSREELEHEKHHHQFNPINETSSESESSSDSNSGYSSDSGSETDSEEEKEQEKIKRARLKAAAVNSSAGTENVNAHSGDYSRGSLIGEAEVLTGSVWASTIFARRDCELVAMKRQALELVTSVYPSAGLHFATKIAAKLHHNQLVQAHLAHQSAPAPPLSPQKTTKSRKSLRKEKRQQRRDERRREKEEGEAEEEEVPRLAPPHLGSKPRGPSFVVDRKLGVGVGAASGLKGLQLEKKASSKVLLKNITPNPPSPLRISNLAVLPVGVRASNCATFSIALKEALADIAPARRVTSMDALVRLGDVWFQRGVMLDLALTSWLSDLEETYRLLLLEGDPCAGSQSKPTSWTRRCLRAADAVLLVVDSDNDIMNLQGHFGADFFEPSDDRPTPSAQVSSSWFGQKKQEVEEEEADEMKRKRFTDGLRNTSGVPMPDPAAAAESTHWAAALGGELGECLRWAKYQMKLPIHLVVLHSTRLPRTHEVDEKEEEKNSGGESGAETSGIENDDDEEEEESSTEGNVDMMKEARAARRKVRKAVARAKSAAAQASASAAAATRAAVKKGSGAVKSGLKALNAQFQYHFRFRTQITDWAEQQDWIDSLFHIRLGRDPRSGKAADDLTMQKQHCGRLARQLTGRAVGLTLGGGGARGLAHLGVIRALEEAGVVIDMVGGTSQGAFVAALLALYPDDPTTREKKAKLFSLSMGSVWGKLLDLTLPIVSYFSASQFNFSIRVILGGSTRIQDLWLPFHCVSTDISLNREVVHTKGSLWKSVRASMTLAGYLPPIWLNGSMLVDGGYLNVVPADVMARLGADTIIAVDVSPGTDEFATDMYDFGSSLSGTWLLWNKLNPFSDTVRVPSMGEISSSLMWVSSERQLESIRRDPRIDLMLRPPVEKYGTLEFDKYEEIVERGYRHANEQLKLRMIDE